MQRCLLVENRITKVAEYLTKRSLYEVTEERSALSTIDPDKMDIIDVDVLVYIYYTSDDGDLSFRSDMNSLRKLLQCSFFHVDSATFILVNATNPLLEDLIRVATRSSNLVDDKLDIVKHEGALMLEDVAKYLSGQVSGIDTSSTYSTVYITQAELDEKDRFDNEFQGVEAILPVLTDAVHMYSQRANIEASVSGHKVMEEGEIPKRLGNFTDIEYTKAARTRGFLFSGMKYTGYEKSMMYMAEYSRRVGLRCLVVNMDVRFKAKELKLNASVINVADMRIPQMSSNMVNIVDAKFSQLGYVIQYLKNVQGVDLYIFLIGSQMYPNVRRLLLQVCDDLYSSFVIHFDESAMIDYIEDGIVADTVFLSTEAIYNDFDVTKYRSHFRDVIVARYPTGPVDYAEFYDLIAGDGNNENK